MNIISLIIIVIVLLFGLVILVGAPYLPTLGRQTKTALDVLALKKGQTLLELGCGDGHVLRAAAKRGIKGVGYEINPILVIVARVNTWRYRKLVSIRWGNYWTSKWPSSDAIFVFLLDKYMKKLDKTITQKYKGKKVKLASVAFKIPGKKLLMTKDGVHFYRYQ